MWNISNYYLTLAWIGRISIFLAPPPREISLFPLLFFPVPLPFSPISSFFGEKIHIYAQRAEGQNKKYTTLLTIAHGVKCQKY